MNIFLLLNLLYRLIIPAELPEHHECPNPSYLNGIGGGSQQRSYIVATDYCNPTSRGQRIYLHEKK